MSMHIFTYGYRNVLRPMCIWIRIVSDTEAKTLISYQINIDYNISLIQKEQKL